jgi:1-deoxy-D-xylulose 5-phosphate reductoisomerase
MVAYKQPDFAERTALAQNAKQKMLDQMRAKQPADPAVIAERQARAALRDAAAAEARNVRSEALAQAKAEKRMKAEMAAQQDMVAAKPTLSAAEQKAARDIRYAARKSRSS